MADTKGAACIAPKFGLPIDSTSGNKASLRTSPPSSPFSSMSTTSDHRVLAWLLFTSAVMTDNGVRDKFVESAWTRASFNGSDVGVPDQYNDDSGAVVDGLARYVLSIL